MTTHTPAAVPRGRPAPLLASTGLLALVSAFVVLGYEGRRVAQLLVLFLPAIVWLAWPLRSRTGQRVRHLAVWIWALLFMLDSTVRGFLLGAYNAAPDSSLVLGAAANSNAREALEYLQTGWRAPLLWLVACVVTAALAWRLARGGALAQATGSPRWLTAVLCLCLLVAAVGYLSKPWRRLHPVVFWTQWAHALQDQRLAMADQQRLRTLALERAHAAAPTIALDGPATVVVVITDSVNRDNMSLYGYERATTPRLSDQAQQLGDQFLTLRNAWSVDASTLPALRNIFGFGRPDAPDAHHLLALARAAGYKVWWMSNHDDIGIEQQHARLADVVDFANRTPGRAGASLDGELLDCIQEALEDPTPRKLIVVHMLGAHPHYRLRYPSGQNPFDDGPDQVDRAMEQQGRAGWVRRFRQDYDAALLYHDFVVAETLQMTRTVGAQQGYHAWMYLSDHGQEVGHVRDHAGHSPTSASGYRIPALLWRNAAPDAGNAGIATRPFRADWAGWTLADLMHLQWQGAQPSRNVLDPGYRWEPPQLPIQVPDFER